MQRQKMSLLQLIIDRLLTAAGTAMRRRADRKQRFNNIVVPVDDIIGVRLFSTGIFEQTHLDGVLEYIGDQTLPDNAIMIDVGANIGVYSVALSQYFEQIYAFEANRLTSDILKINLELSSSENVVPINLALSDSARSDTIQVPQNGNLGWASIDADGSEGVVNPVEITCEKLDQFLEDNSINPQSIELIKIDVEGHELQALKGAESTLRRARPTLLCEIMSTEKAPDIVNYLKEIGYSKFYTFKRSYKNLFDTKVRLVETNEVDLGGNALVLVM